MLIHSVCGVVGADGVVDSWVCSETPVFAVVGVGCVTVGGVLGGAVVGELADSVVGLAMDVGGDVPADVEVDSLGCSETEVNGAVVGVVGGGELGLSVEGLGLSVDGLGLSVAGLLSVDGGTLVDDSVDAAGVVSVVSIGTVVSSVVGAVSVVV